MVISRQNHKPKRGSSLAIDAGSLPVPATYLAIFLDQSISDDAQRQRLSAAAGLDTRQLHGRGQTLPLALVLRALKAIDVSLAPGWHIAPALSLQAAQHGPLGLAVVTAANVQASLDTLVRFEPTRAPWTLIRRYCDDDDLVIEVVARLPSGDAGELLMEINLLALASLVGQVLGRHRQALRLVLPRRYRAWDDLLRDQLECELDFDGSRHVLRIPRKLLQSPCLLADPELHEMMIARCKRETAAGEPGGLANQVRQILMDNSGRSPGLSALAGQLNLSPRSLNRCLARAGTGYRALIDDVRQTLARELLWHSDLAIERIAERLGYRDASNFNRAFRRWYGISPGTLRRQGAGRS